MLHFPHAAPRSSSGLRAPAPVGTSREMVAALRSHWGLVAACLVLCLAIAGAALSQMPRTYQASARVLLEPRRSEPFRNLNEREFVQASLDVAQIESQIQVLRSEQVYKAVIEAHALASDPEFAEPRLSVIALVRGWMVPQAPPPTGYNAIVEVFDQHIDVRRVGQSHVLQVTFQSADPAKAARLANAVAAAYIGRQLAPRIEAVRRSGQFERAIRELSADSASVSQAVASGQIDVSSFPQADARIITAAQIPLGASSPRTVLILGFAACMGLLTGGIAAMTRFRLKRSIASPAQIGGELGIAALGSFPRTPAADAAQVMFRQNRPREGSELDVAGPRLGLDTSLREIRTAFEMVAVSSMCQCVGVTSAARGEGKSLIASHLAAAFAAAGRRTLLVDANADNPSLSAGFAAIGRIEPKKGLVQVLASGEPERSLHPTAIANLTFMSIGRGAHSAHISDMIDTASAKTLMAALKGSFDRIVFDLPAFCASPDAWAFGSLLDAYILVVRAGATSQRTVAQMVASLEATPAAVAGAVFNSGGR